MGRWLDRNLFRAAATALLCVLTFSFLWILITADEQLWRVWRRELYTLSITEVGLVLSFVLFLCFLIQYADSLIPRLRKVGPIEVIEQQGPDTLNYLEDLEVELAAHQFVVSGGRPISDAERAEIDWYYYKLRPYVDTVRHADISRSDLAASRKYQDLVFRLGKYDFQRKNWARAADLYMHLARVTHGRYRSPYEGPGDFHLNCGVTHVLWADDTKIYRLRRQRYFTAIDHLKKAARLEDENVGAHFWLAWAFDELGKYHSAIESLKKAQSLHPRRATIKYNLAIAHIKLADLQTASELLTSISPDDDQAHRVFVEAYSDPELEPLLSDKDFGPKIRVLVEYGWQICSIGDKSTSKH